MCPCGLARNIHVSVIFIRLFVQCPHYDGVCITKCLLRIFFACVQSSYWRRTNDTSTLAARTPKIKWNEQQETHIYAIEWLLLWLPIAIILHMQSTSSEQSEIKKKERKNDVFFSRYVRFALNDNLTLSWTHESNDLLAHFFVISLRVAIEVRISYPIKAINLCRLGDETFLFHINFICCFAVFSPLIVQDQWNCASGSSSHTVLQHRIMSH